MAGLVGMAQVLAIFHTDFYTLRQGRVQTYGSMLVPTDAAAILEWGLDDPFIPHDRPPLAIAMLTTMDGVRQLRRYQLVVAHRSKLRLEHHVAAALAPASSTHRLTQSGFFPCSTNLEILYGYAADGYRSPLWLCAAHDGWAVLIRRNRGTKLYFQKAVQEKRVRVIRGIHYFDAHRLDPQLLGAPELQINPRTENIAGLEGADEAMFDPESEDEVSDDDAAASPEDDQPWCPPCQTRWTTRLKKSWQALLRSLTQWLNSAN